MYFLALLFLGIVTSAWAGEYAVLANGARLHADRHRIEGARIRLYNGDGFIEMSAALVVGFEDDGHAAAATAPPQQAAAAPATPRQLADAAADKYGLPRQLVRSVMSAESGFQTGAVSPKGAIGLMQLMPETARRYSVSNIWDPVQNIHGGVRYLADLLRMFNNDHRLAVAAYNAGEKAVMKYGNRIPPYAETTAYVPRVMSYYRRYRTGF